MNTRNLLELYKNIELSARHIENIRFELSEIHEKTILEYNKSGKKKSPHVIDWFKSQQKFLNPQINRELESKGLRTLDYKMGVSFYFVDKDTYNELRTSQNTFGNIRFNILRNYFGIKRLQTAISQVLKDDLRLTIEYRSSETPGDLFENGVFSKMLSDVIQFNEDVQLLINIEKLNYWSKMPSYLFPVLVSNESGLGNFSFYLKERGPRRDSIKKRGYILSADSEKFIDIADTTENNMKALIDDKNLYDKIVLIVNDFENRKFGV